MLTPFSTGYVDLMSPAGIGIAGVVYNYDGDVYASDEGRMLAEMGNKAFRLGNVRTDAYGDIFLFGSNCSIRIDIGLLPPALPCVRNAPSNPTAGLNPSITWRHKENSVGRKPESDFCNVAIWAIFVD